MSISLVKTTHQFSKTIIESINKDLCMDNFLKSGECVKVLINIASQVLQLLLNKGFRLTKWIADSQIKKLKSKIKELTY